MFDNAFTVAPLTLPAHASLLTAAYPPRHGVHDNHVSALGTDVPTFPVRLRARGYATAAFVSAIVLDHRYGLSRGFDTYDDEIAGPERSAAETLARAERWIEAAPRPLFTWIHCSSRTRRTAVAATKGKSRRSTWPSTRSSVSCAANGCGMTR